MKDYEIGELVGIPYSYTGKMPEEGFNCWEFLRYVQARYYNRRLPVAALDGSQDLLKLHIECMDQGLYTMIHTDPIDGDCALLRDGTRPHVGVWLENDHGGVLHCMEGVGVIWTRRSELLRYGYGRASYYRVK
jgi:hypothetical protein